MGDAPKSGSPAVPNCLARWRWGLCAADAMTPVVVISGRLYRYREPEPRSAWPHRAVPALQPLQPAIRDRPPVGFARAMAGQAQPAWRDRPPWTHRPGSSIG